MKPLHNIALGSLFTLTSCAEAINSKLLEPPVTPDIAKECFRKTERSNFEWNNKLFVTFNRALCLHDGGEVFWLQKPYGLKTNGTEINSAYVDVVFDSFSVLEYEGKSMSDFLNSLIKTNIGHEGICEAKQISENVWIIDDGLPDDVEINFMPCGPFGRNISDQTLFKVNDLAVLHYTIPSKNDELDKSSIRLEMVE